MGHQPDSSEFIKQVNSEYPTMRYHFGAIGAAAIAGILINRGMYLEGVAGLSTSVGLSAVAGMRHNLHVRKALNSGESVDQT